MIARLVRMADFLDKEGLKVEADYIDSLIQRFAEGEKVPAKEAPVPEEDPGMDLQKDIDKISQTKKRFVEKFYKKLLDSHNQIRKIVNQKNFGYLGDQRREILLISFDSLIHAMEDEFRKFSVEAAGRILGKMVDNSKVIKDVYKVFTPILDLYESFDRFMISYPDFASKFPRTKSAFLNLKNVINNVIKGVPEEILDIEMTK